MNKFIAPILAATLALSASTAFAGGPVIIEDEVEVIVENPHRRLASCRYC
jgi:hypothetical protein